jgi:hypothetical protein
MLLKLTLALLLIFSSFPLGVMGNTMDQEWLLHPIHTENPYIEEKEDSGQKCYIKMIKIRNHQEVITPPETEANILYYGKVKLGSPAKEYGMLLDLEGENKFIWVDSDGNKDYSGETKYQIFKSDRYPGIEVYYSPVPLAFLVEYHFKDQVFINPLQMDLPYLLLQRAGFDDYLILKTRTWLTTNLLYNGEEIPVALVDLNHNGTFNDPEDMIYLDSDYDLNFAPQEGKILKEAATIRLKSRKRLKLDYQFVPEKLIVIKDGK